MARNNNCLEGFRCPACGQVDQFKIATTLAGFVVMSDDGTVEESIESIDWGDDDSCMCTDCGYDGVVNNFNMVLTDEGVELINNDTLCRRYIATYGAGTPAVDGVTRTKVLTWWLDGNGWNAYEAGSEIPIYESKSVNRFPDHDITLYLIERLFDESYDIFPEEG